MKLSQEWADRDSEEAIRFEEEFYSDPRNAKVQLLVSGHHVRKDSDFEWNGHGVTEQNLCYNTSKERFQALEWEKLSPTWRSTIIFTSVGA